MNADPNDFLNACEIIDWESDHVRALALKLNHDDEIRTATACFEFVRDEIKHSSDHKMNPVTCRASDVLKHGTGYCYAKSHLLCALLRANKIPAGLCYQRLTISGDKPPFSLHGLNAVHLASFGWYRIDPRGNRAGIDAQFNPPNEQLAFPIACDGERDIPTIYVEPLPEVVRCLTTWTTWDEVYSNLPDIDDAT